MATIERVVKDLWAEFDRQLDKLVYRSGWIGQRAGGN